AGPDVSYSSSSRNIRNPSAIGGTLPAVSGFNGNFSGNIQLRSSINGVTNVYYITTDSAGRQVVMRDSSGTLVRDTTLQSRPGGFPMINFGGAFGGVGGPGAPFGLSMYATFGSLMALDDGNGVNRGWLGSEAAYQWMKSFEERNLLIPVVGNFGGPKALRAVS